MSIVINRQGMTQTQRLFPALDPSYYSIDERELIEHIRYLQRYAKKLRFHQQKDIETETKENEKQFWSKFLNFTEQELIEIVSILKQPTLLEQNPALQSKYFQSHYSLVFTFIQLLDYPKLRMAQLTREHLDYCYQLSLQMSQKAARADKVHVIVELASYIEQLALDKGTLVYAGEDTEGRRVEFEVSQDMLFNHAQVSDICSVQFDQAETGLAEIRSQAGEGLVGFNAMLLHALGGLENLPPFPKLLGLEQTLSLSQLLNNWYPDIRELSAEQLSQSDREYVFNRLNFLSLFECQFVFDVLYRDTRQGAEGVLPVTEREWQQVYRIMAVIHDETHRKSRIAQLKQWHQEKGINGLLEWLFGAPGPSDMLHAFPKLNVADFTQKQQQAVISYPVAVLYFSQTSAAERYVQKHLCMEYRDFSQLMSNILGETSVISWELVYRLLEKAWSKKRHYQYPSITDTRVTGMQQQVLHTSLDNIQPFSPFQGGEAAEMGLQLQSDLLLMNEGDRKVELIIDCKGETLPLNTLAELGNRFAASEFFKVSLSTEQGWQEVPEYQFDFGDMFTEPVIRDTASHTVQIFATSYTLSNQSDTLKAQLLGQYIALENGCCFEIEQVIRDGQEFQLRPVLYQSGQNAAALIAKFNLVNESGGVSGGLSYSFASQILSAGDESFSPEQQGHFVVDDSGNVYQIQRFVNASEIEVSILCRTSNAEEFANKVWKSLQPEFVPNLNLSDVQLTHATLYDPDIDIRVTGNSIDFTCPDACSAQQLFSYWQQATITDGLSTSHFELQLPGSGNTLLPEGEKALPAEDRWLKRYRSLREHGLDVTFEGRRDEAASVAILPANDEPKTQFLLKGNELNIIPAVNATANEVAAAWRHWRSANDGSNFNVMSQDKRLLALQPLSEQSMLPLDIQEKAYHWLDAKQNGLRFSYLGASAQPASVLLKENIIDDYDFEISADNVLTVLYPLCSRTLGSSLIKAWTKWHSDILNDAKGFAIQLVGDDILDIAARAEFELGPVYQVLLGNETLGVAIKYFGDLADGSILNILEADVFKAEFELTPTHILIRVPQNSSITAQELLLHWQDWQVANPASGLELDLIVYGEDDFTIVPQTQLWTHFGAKGEVGEHGLAVDYTCSQHPDQKPNAKVICWENTEVTDAFEFSFENDELTDSAVLHISYPQNHSERTIEKLVQNWLSFLEANSPLGFSIAAAGEGSWQVSGDKRCELIATPRAHYRISTAGSAYIQFDFVTEAAGVPHLSMAEHADRQFDIQFELPEVEQTAGVPNLTLYYPEQSEYQTAENLYDAWYQLEQHHGFVLRDNSLKLVPRTLARLAETGNQIKYLDYYGLRLRYVGSKQDVTLKLSQQSPFDDSTEGQQLLLDSGLLFAIGKKLNRNTANIELSGVVDFQQRGGIYPADSVKRHSMRITTEVDASFMPVMPIPDAEFAGTEKAAIKVQLNPGYGMDEPYFLYPVFRDIVIEQAMINVEVRNLTSVIARSRDSSLDTQSELALFGHELGHNDYFDFAHPELCGKPLQALYCEYDWRELTDPITKEVNQLPNIQTYYKSYGLLDDHSVADVANEDFTTSLAIFNRNRWHASGQTQNLLVAEQHYSALADMGSEPGLLTSPKEVSNWQTHFRLQLHGNFYHSAYRQLQQKLQQIQREASSAQAAFSSAVQAKQAYHEEVKATRIALEQARQSGEVYQAAPIAAVPDLPNPREDAQEFNQFELPLPFSPLLNKLKLGYRTSGVVNLSKSWAATAFEMPVELYRQQPFGIRKMAGEQDSDDTMLPVYQHQGYLYLGLTNLSAGQSVSLLFQIAPGTGEVSHERDDASWSYLAGENWQALPQAALLKDETYHLQNTGLLQLTLPSDATTAHTVMPANRIWLRMAFERDIMGLPTIVGVHTQAVLAKYVLNEQAVERLQAPLAENTITALVEPLPGLQALKQPYASFAGRAVESDQDYYQRVAERLKHKQRCLTLTDYETLVLGEFSELHQVLCMPNVLYREQREGADFLLTEEEKDLKLIIIAKSAPTFAGLAMRPSASQLLIDRVQAFVDRHKPVRTQVEVINPGFEELSFRLAVKFKPGFDKGFYVKTLNQAIVDYLSPWSHQKQASLNFGRTLYSAAVVNFIESQAYVEYVANFTLLRQEIAHQGYQEVVPLFLNDDHAASSLYSGNLLVSADQHIIDVIESELYDADAYRGIGYMQIGADYWVDRPGADFRLGLGQLMIESPRIYPELLEKELQLHIPEQGDIAMLWQALLEKEYVTEQYEIGPHFNTDLGLNGFEVELAAEVKLMLYQLFIARRQWQPSEYRWQLD
ncbi:baseplate J/gp47 family protein [uncultured Shewanella sp.]|uniref:baseplate J/gp47 family protein n=1 Tax=uncultured Shewanella sp. TaxID=173975 RepID=UPI00260DA59F|nr:baseplate J/gp47 family protein [uncultured Shewanella sp.]